MGCDCGYCKKPVFAYNEISRKKDGTLFFLGNGVIKSPFRIRIKVNGMNLVCMLTNWDMHGYHEITFQGDTKAYGFQEATKKACAALGTRLCSLRHPESQWTINLGVGDSCGVSVRVSDLNPSKICNSGDTPEIFVQSCSNGQPISSMDELKHQYNPFSYAQFTMLFQPRHRVFTDRKHPTMEISAPKRLKRGQSEARAGKRGPGRPRKVVAPTATPDAVPMHVENAVVDDDDDDDANVHLDVNGWTTNAPATEWTADLVQKYVGQNRWNAPILEEIEKTIPGYYGNPLMVARFKHPITFEDVRLTVGSAFLYHVNDAYRDMALQAIDKQGHIRPTR